jgi:hypothetical protein
MRPGVEQIGAVAPWFDVTNSYQRYWIHAHRWKGPEYLSECLLELIPSLAHLDVLHGPDVVQPRTAADQSVGAHALKWL